MGGFGIAGAGEHASALLLKLGWARKAPGFYVKEPAGLQDALHAAHVLAEAGAVSGCHLISYTERVDLEGVLGGKEPVSAPTAIPAPRTGQLREEFGFGGPYGMQGAAPAPSDPLAALIASGMLDEGEDGPSDARDSGMGSGEAAEDDETARARAEREAREEEEYALQMMQEMGLR